MCGIIGLCGDRDPDVALFDAARDCMHTRGPDGFGTVRLDNPEGTPAIFGHRRLSVQDLSEAGKQPMMSASGRYWIVYNGEVYNAPDLRRELQEHGCRFRSTSDTEVILEGYSRWGAAVVARLHGIFAFAIWDIREQRLFAARDRVGVKPFYYALDRNRLAFASSARALRHLGFGAELDPDALSLYLCLGYVPAPRSIWAGIQKLDAGHTLEWSEATGLERSCYWTAPEDTDFEGHPRRLEDLIDEVVEEQLLSDVPVGLFLSGGLDSSVIASSIASAGSSAANVTAITVGFPGNRRRNEAPIALRTAQALGIECRELALSANTRPFYRAAVEALDEPLAYSAIVTQTAISQLAAGAGLKVVLSGDGGDEVFGGYRWYGRPMVESGATVRNPFARFLLASGLIPAMQRTRLHHQKLAETFEKAPLIAHAWSLFRAFRPDQAAALLPEGDESNIRDLLHDVLSRFDAPRLPEKRRRQRIDLFTFCQDAVLTKVDRAGMAYGVEARPPLLDHRIVEWGLSRPITDEDDAAPKNALRAIVRKRGLGFLLNEPKRGFSLQSRNRFSRREMRRLVARHARDAGLRDNWKSVLRNYPGSRLELETLFFFVSWRLT